MHAAEPKSPPDTDSPLVFGSLPLVAEIETDRFCDECGYNLRTQAVRRDTQTGLLLARCPECGRYHAANQETSASRPWLRRLATMLLSWWVLFLAGYVGIATLAVACSHWRRRWYYVAAITIAVVPTGFIIVLLLLYEDGRGPQWAYPFLYGLLVVQVLGGAFGALVGRPVARGLVRMFLPPRARQALAFLWTADGKIPPTTATDRKPSTAQDA